MITLLLGKYLYNVIDYCIYSGFDGLYSVAMIVGNGAGFIEVR